MSWKFAIEMKSLLNSPIVAMNALKCLLSEDGAHKERDCSVNQEAFRVIIDDDGNATLNFKNKKVREEFAAHVRALSSEPCDKSAPEA